MTTYNILIVDDEPLIKANLKMYISNLKQNYRIIGDASNGEEALKILADRSVDIVLSDVMMPVMNGIELSEHIHNKYPDIVLVMLSNYDDFDYVKTTLINGAKDYILKHTLNVKVLEQCLNHITESLKQQINPSDFEVQNNLPQLQHQFVLKLIEGQEQDQSILIEEMRMLDLPIDNHNIVVAAIDIDDYIQFSQTVTLARIKAVQASIISLVNQTMDEQIQNYIAHIEGGRYVMLLSFNSIHSAAKVNRKLMVLLQAIKSNLNRFLNLSVTIGYSYLCRDISHVSDAYQVACQSIQKRFSSGKNKIYDHTAIDSVDREVLWIPNDLKQQLSAELNYGDSTSLIQILKDLFNDLRKKKVEYNQCQLLLYDLLNLLSQSSITNNILPSDLYDLSTLNLRIFDTLDDVEDFITKLYVDLYQRISTGTCDDYSEITKKAITFIMNQYGTSISLAETADHLSITKSYLSNLFKTEVGIGFSKYLTNIRIENAKKMMAECKEKNCDLESIAESCGFNSYTYFSTTFKKIEGVSPAQHMRTHR